MGFYDSIVGGSFTSDRAALLEHATRELATLMDQTCQKYGLNFLEQSVMLSAIMSAQSQTHLRHKAALDKIIAEKR